MLKYTVLAETHNVPWSTLWNDGFGLGLTKITVCVQILLALKFYHRPSQTFLHNNRNKDTKFKSAV